MTKPNRDLDEFESQTRETIEQTLNYLHTASLLVGQLETQIVETGRSLQVLSQLIESFIAQQRQQGNSDSTD